MSESAASAPPVKKGKIPEPPSKSGDNVFPSPTAFPPPRPFVAAARNYRSGNTKGSTFNLSQL
ncbi:aminotransferase class I and II protein [Ceratobasidium sp. AG-Ba]|nr:aminotransferase class I and II protein [Ceratobasidium sp. AG-Ba]